jgi:hypothetical protein
MELGNMIFGNSRGQYPVPRDWEDEVRRLFEEIEKQDREFNNYPYQEYENDVFHIFPYYWGDCTCGFEDIQYKIEGELAHRPDCYQTRLKEEKLRNGFVREKAGNIELVTAPDGNSFDSRLFKYWRDLENKIQERLCEEFGLSFPHGAAVHCTCDYDERYGQILAEKGYPEGHLSSCPIIWPNFKHKSTGFEIQWYKYPFRDSYMNMNISLDDFSKIIDNCIESLKE